MNIEVWIPIVLSCVMAIVAIITLAKNTKKDTQDDAVQKATLAADLKYIRDGVDDIKLDNRVIKEDIGKLQTKVARIEQSVESAHQRIDDMKKG
jgi:hypothetical protein